MTEAFGYRHIIRQVQEKAKACGRRPDEITLIAVSKNHPVSSIEKTYQSGARDFGESRIQEALGKIPFLPSDCRWHLIGSLQTNKVGKAVAAFQLIHSVDSTALARKISQVSEARGMTASVLLQVNTSGERTKHGLSAEEWENALAEVIQLPHLQIEGLMTMAPLTEDQQLIRHCFRTLRLLRDRWRNRMKDPDSFQHLSMGMSHDYLIAIEEGATLLRIGTAIFGERES